MRFCWGPLGEENFSRKQKADGKGESRAAAASKVQPVAGNGSTIERVTTQRQAVQHFAAKEGTVQPIAAHPSSIRRAGNDSAAGRTGDAPGRLFLLAVIGLLLRGRNVAVLLKMSQPPQFRPLRTALQSGANKRERPGKPDFSDGALSKGGARFSAFHYPVSAGEAFVRRNKTAIAPQNPRRHPR